MLSGPEDRTGSKDCADPEGGVLASSRTFYSKSLHPLPSLRIPEAKTRTQSHLYVPSTNGTESSWVPQAETMFSVPHPCMSPYHVHTCNTHAHVFGGPRLTLWTLIQTTHFSQSRNLTSGLYFLPKAPLLTTYQLTLPMSLLFRATRNKGLIC